MNRNKLLALLLALCTVLALMVSFALAEEPTPAPEPDPEPTAPAACEHNWKVGTTVSCTTDGKRICTKCGVVEITPATGHSWKTKEATCTADGLKLCQNCGTTETIPATGHNWKTKEATCTADGMRLCQTCGTTETLTALGHDMTVDVAAVAPTCTEAGSTAGKKCSRCDVTEGVEAVAALGHKYEKEITVKPTYYRDGEATYTCSVCGDSYTERIRKLTRPTATEQPVAEDVPVADLGDIVTDVTRQVEEYKAEIVEEGVNHVLVITADPDESGVYALRNLHITDELLAKMAADHIEIVRFVVGTATVEFPVASFTGEVMTAIKADLASPAKEFIVTVDPTATTAEGNPGCSVSASIACEDGSEFDITGVVEGLTVTMNGVAQAVTEAAVYAA